MGIVLKGIVMRRIAFMWGGYAAFLAFLVATNFELTGTREWFLGAGCGVGLAWAMSQSAAIRIAAGLVGGVLLGAAAFGFVDVQPDHFRSFLQGVAVAMFLSLPVWVWLHWPKVHDHLRLSAEVAGDEHTLRWLDAHPPRR